MKKQTERFDSVYNKKFSVNMEIRKVIFLVCSSFGRFKLIIGNTAAAYLFAKCIKRHCPKKYYGSANNFFACGCAHL